MINCNYSPIFRRFRDIDLYNYQKITIFHSLLGGPDAWNDLKLISGVQSLSIYHIPKNQISETKKLMFRDLSFDLQSHPRSKVMVQNKESDEFTH